ncbi:anti-sigma factor antagonist [Deinococcus roseus]|uniref:Anti-sigma factor antagonist n=1 Tax=Deinococcus roseus TaxID=392414 RepID=A0ABQ2DBA1_9DEIO|nr:anti-sigma factor antagonist [Deinococcus roseus]GGJ52078.1 anti-sigma factor antagonist [Deinococcus roseus]
MEISSSTVDGVVVAQIIGDIDGKTAPIVQQKVVSLIPDGGKILLDMGQVEYMSSAGLRMLLLVYRQAQSKGSKIALSGLSEDIADTMSATGFLDYFVTSTTVEEGLQALA